MAELWIYDTIGSGFAEDSLTAKTIRDDLDQLGEVDSIDVRINSPGGDVFEAVAIKALLDQHPAAINIKIDGLSASAATMIQMAGDTVEMAQGSMLMIHEPWGLTIGDEGDHLAQASALGKIGEQIALMYSGRGKKTAGEFRDLMKAETWLSAEEAVEYGLADTLTETALAACVVSEEFGYKHTPAAFKEPQRAVWKPEQQEYDIPRNRASAVAMGRKLDLTRRRAKI